MPILRTCYSALMFDLPEITIRSISVGDMDNNVYLITHKTSGTQVLIDAADDANAIKTMIQESENDTEQRPKVTHVVTTHSHWDHVRALPDIAELTGATTAAGEQDVPDIETPTDLPLKAGVLNAGGGLELEIIELRGHTPGSIALLYQDPEGPAHLFSGDSLFPGGVGNTFQDPERFATLIDDITHRVFAVLPDSTIVTNVATARIFDRPYFATVWRACPTGWVCRLRPATRSVVLHYRRGLRSAQCCSRSLRFCGPARMRVDQRLVRTYRRDGAACQPRSRIL